MVGRAVSDELWQTNIIITKKKTESSVLLIENDLIIIIYET